MKRGIFLNVSISSKDSSKKSIYLRNFFSRQNQISVNSSIIWCFSTQPTLRAENEIDFQFRKIFTFDISSQNKIKIALFNIFLLCRLTCKKFLSLLIILSVRDMLRTTAVNIVLIMIIVIMSVDRKEALEEVGLILSVYCCLPREWGGERGECCRFSQTSFLTLRSKKYRYRHQLNEHCFRNIVDNQQCLQFGILKTSWITFALIFIPCCVY